MTTSTALLSRIQHASYLVSPATVQELARQHTIALNRKDSCAGTYLAILIASLQDRYKKQPAEAPAMLLDAIHKMLYAAVIEGISTTELTKEQVSSRATFARTAKATLLAYVRANGAIKALQPGATSKEWLRKETSALLESANDGHSTADRITSGIRKAVGYVIQLARDAVKHDDIEEARRELRLAMSLLSDELDALDDETNVDEAEEDRPRIVAKRLRRSSRQGSLAGGVVGKPGLPVPGNSAVM